MLAREVVDATSLETFQVILAQARDLAEDIPCHCTEVGVDVLLSSFPIQSILRLYNKIACICARPRKIKFLTAAKTIL